MIDRDGKIMLPIGIDQIKAMLPHQYPFLLLDKVVDLVPGQYGCGIKNVTYNEPFFRGHFPKEAVMPGVLLVEAMAQLIVIVYGSEALAKIDQEEQGDSIDLSARVGYLAAIKNVKFLKKVVPGDQLKMHAEVIGKMGPVSQTKVWSEVDGLTVVKGVITVSES